MTTSMLIITITHGRHDSIKNNYLCRSSPGYPSPDVDFQQMFVLILQFMGGSSSSELNTFFCGDLAQYWIRL